MAPAALMNERIGLGGRTDEIEIQLGLVCNERCVFCESGRFTELGMARSVPVAEIVNALRRAAGQGTRKVTFDGGEPTIQENFLPALRHAAALGFEHIVVFTNGARVTPAFVDEVTMAGAGRVQWRFSIQGGNEAAHDRATQRPGSFAKVVAGITHLRARGQTVTANMCVNELSYRSLVDYPALVTGLGVQSLHIDMFRPGQLTVISEEEIRAIMCRYSDMVPYLRSMLAEFDRLSPGFDVTVGNLPYCLMPEWAHRIRHGGEGTATYGTDGSQLGAPVDKYARQRADAVYAPRCGECAVRSCCRGVPEKYAALHGTDELEPLSPARLAALGPDGRHFVPLAEPHLRPLIDATPPEGWTQEAVVRAWSDRRWEIHYRHRGTGRLELIFTAPEEMAARPGPAPVLTTNRYRIAMRAEGRAPARKLAAWAIAKLRSVSGLEVIAPGGTAGPAPLAGESERVQRTQALLVRHARRLEEQAPLEGWRHRQTDAHDGRRVVLAFQGPEGHGVSVALEIDDSPRARVSATFELADGTPPDEGRSVIERLAAALRA
jgi:hypothetical protein